MPVADKAIVGAHRPGDAASMAPISPKLWRRIDEYVDDETLLDEATPFADQSSGSS